MAKIRHYRIPVHLSRDPGNNHVSLDIKHDLKTIEKDEPISLNNGGDLLRITKEVSDFNDIEMQLVKHVLSTNETEKDSYITYKFIEE